MMVTRDPRNLVHELGVVRSAIEKSLGENFEIGRVGDLRL